MRSRGRSSQRRTPTSCWDDFAAQEGNKIWTGGTGTHWATGQWCANMSLLLQPSVLCTSDKLPGGCSVWLGVLSDICSVIGLSL